MAIGIFLLFCISTFVVFGIALTFTITKALL